MGKVGRPRKYATPEEARLADLAKRREQYRNLKGGQVRCHTKYGEGYRGSFWAYKCSSLKTKCSQQELSFDLTPEYLEEIYTDTCPIFGVKMEIGSGANAPSVDRIVPSKGYTKGNVVWVSMRANSIKGDSSLEELKAVTDWLERNLTEKAQE